MDSQPVTPSTEASLAELVKEVGELKKLLKQTYSILIIIATFAFLAVITNN